MNQNSVLGGPWGALGGQDPKGAKDIVFWGRLGDHLGAVLGASWGRLGAWIGVLGRLGPSWGHLGPSWEPLGAVLALRSPSWAVLEHLGALLSRLKIDVKIDQKIDAFEDRFLQ